MADLKNDAREMSWRRLVPWTELFNGFKLTLDPNKLFLAAAGILVMAFAWWLLAVVFGAAYRETPPDWGTIKNRGDSENTWRAFKEAREDWNLMHKAANIGQTPEGDAPLYEPADLASTPEELAQLLEAARNISTQSTLIERQAALTKAGVPAKRVAFLAVRLNNPLVPKPRGMLNTWPWFEPRGPNPYLMVTGQTGKPWETGHFWEWFASEQAPVLIEPLVKLLSPVIYLLNPHATLFTRLYFFLVLLSTLVIWSVFGGAIARITVLYQTRKEQIDAVEAFRFSRRRLLSYVGAPLFPLVIALFCVVIAIVLGVFYLIPYIGDILVAGFGWFVFVALGAAMAVLLIGLVSWPLMPATISTEGRDSWEAFSRAYAYLFSKPWQYIWYGLVAIAYGAVLVFFVNFLASFALYLSKWSLNQTPFIAYFHRQPNFLFIHAPTTFDYRTLLLEGATAEYQKEGQPKEVQPVVQNGQINPLVFDRYVSQLSPNNRIGAILVAGWLGLILLFIVGFGYAYFWTASTLIYLLLRRQIDTAEVDEVYLDDEETGYKAPATVPQRPASTPTPTPTNLATPTPGPQLVEPPTLKLPTTPATQTTSTTTTPTVTPPSMPDQTTLSTTPTPTSPLTPAITPSPAATTPTTPESPIDDADGVKKTDSL